MRGIVSEYKPRDIKNASNYKRKTEIMEFKNTKNIILSFSGSVQDAT